MPSTRKSFWLGKFEANATRDRRNHRKLRRLGWRILTVWECQTKRDKLEVLERRLRRFLGEGATRNAGRGDVTKKRSGIDSRAKVRHVRAD